MAGSSQSVSNSQILTQKEQAYEKIWRIPGWRRVVQTWNSLRSQTFEFKTEQTKWQLGFRLSRSMSQPGFHVYWKLIEANGFPEGQVQAMLICTLLKGDSTAEEWTRRPAMFCEPGSQDREVFACLEWTEIQTKTVKLGQEVEITKRLFFDMFSPAISSNGELTLKLMLSIMETDLTALVDLKMEQFHKSSFEKQRSSMAGLLDEHASADLKIRTSDEMELFAHKVILKAQCPVFESMFRSDFTENRTGVVNVEDVSSKTMRIMLHYFYTGELLPSWKAPDTVVEFTYAAGKYQQTNILKLLDEVLGSRDEEDATHVDMQLLDLAQKLHLKNAEKELVIRIKKMISKVNSGEGLFALYGMQ